MSLPGLERAVAALEKLRQPPEHAHRIAYEAIAMAGSPEAADVLLEDLGEIIASARKLIASPEQTG
jgi:hypothetical protein